MQRIMLQIIGWSLCILGLGFTYVWGQQKNITNEAEGIKRITKNIYTYTEKFGEYKMIFKERVISDYAKKANLISESCYNEKGNLLNKNIYQYNEKAQMINKTLYKSDGTLDKRYTYLYDEKGNKSKETCYNADGSIIHKWIYQYDPLSNTLTTTCYSERKALSRFSHRLTYKYDTNKTEETEYNGDDLIRKIVYLDDEQGNHMEITWYNPDGTLYRKWTYQYDQKGNRTEEACYHADGNLYQKKRWEFVYDDKDRLTELTEYQLVHKFGESYEVPITQTVYEYELY